MVIEAQHFISTGKRELLKESIGYFSELLEVGTSDLKVFIKEVPDNPITAHVCPISHAITINANMYESVAVLISVLSHELVHFKDFKTGKMRLVKSCFGVGTYEYSKKLYEYGILTSTKEYFALPWEVEAFSFQFLMLPYVESISNERATYIKDTFSSFFKHQS